MRTFNQLQSYPTLQKRTSNPIAQKYELDLSDIYGQAYAKRALEIAAIGGHDLLMIGPPGLEKPC